MIRTEIKTEFTDSELEEAMLRSEDAIIAYSKVPIEKSFVYCNIEGHPFRIRVYECGSKQKETIVATFGYLHNQLHYMNLWTRLAERYRVVVFEHGSNGLNTKLKDCSGLQSVDAAEEWVIDWFTALISKLDLPEKFHMLGQCQSCHQVALYASKFPERILSLF